MVPPEFLWTSTIRRGYVFSSEPKELTFRMATRDRERSSDGGAGDSVPWGLPIKPELRTRAFQGHVC